MKIIKRIVAIWVILVIISLIGCIGEITVIKKSYKDSFKATYNSKTDFYQYCDNRGDYKLELEMPNCQVRVILKREDGTWAGHLSLYESGELVESIPISIVDDQIVIHSDNEKRIDLDSLLLYHIDAEDGKIRRADSDVWFSPYTLEIEIGFDSKKLADYMVSFYNNFISELTAFKYKDVYFDSINNFQSAIYHEFPNRYFTGHSLSISFEGKEICPSAVGHGSYNFDNACMVLSEESPY